MELNFQGEVLTPMFLGGADTRDNPELRAPSVRGALRYWFRALIGGIYWNDIIVSKDFENQVFGSNEGRSRVSVLVIPDEQSNFSLFQKDRAIRTSEGDCLPTGKDYLLWSMAESGRFSNPNYRPARKYIAPGSKFQVRLRTFSVGAKEINKAAAALWLLGNLGALGSRANRGAGSLQITADKSMAGAPIFKICDSIDELQSYLFQGIRQSLKTVADEAAEWRTFEQPPSYDILSPCAAEVWIVSKKSGGWSSFSEALNGIGEKFRDFRHHSDGVGKEDHDAVLKWISKGEEDKPKINRAVFGLPLPFSYSQGGPRDVIQPYKGTRRSSPLKIRITRLATGAYVGVLVLFKSRFLAENANLQLQTRKWQAPAPENYKVIQDFIGTFPVRRGVFND